MTPVITIQNNNIIIEVQPPSNPILNLNLNPTPITGKDGLSAYEVGVKNGFEGTEVEWLASLKELSWEVADW